MVDLDDALVARVHELGVVDHVVDHEPVVVARRHVHLERLALETLVGEVEPLLHAREHEALEQRVDLGRVGARVVELLARLVDPVVARVLDGLLDVRELLLPVDLAVLPHDGAFPLVPALVDERHEDLTGEVTQSTATSAP